MNEATFLEIREKITDYLTYDFHHDCEKFRDWDYTLDTIENVYGWEHFADHPENDSIEFLFDCAVKDARDWMENNTPTKKQLKNWDGVEQAIGHVSEFVGGMTYKQFLSLRKQKEEYGNANG